MVRVCETHRGPLNKYFNPLLDSIYIDPHRLKWPLGEGFFNYPHQSVPIFCNERTLNEPYT
jgi:hypothetical protein